MIIERCRRRATPAYISENFLGLRLAGKGPRQAFKLDAPPHHPVQVAPFEPVDERFPGPIRGAERTLYIPTDIFTSDLISLELTQRWIIERVRYVLAPLNTSDEPQICGCY